MNTVDRFLLSALLIVVIVLAVDVPLVKLKLAEINKSEYIACLNAHGSPNGKDRCEDLHLSYKP